MAKLRAVPLLLGRPWTEVSPPASNGLGTSSFGAYLWSYPLGPWLRPHLRHGAGALALVLSRPSQTKVREPT